VNLFWHLGVTVSSLDPSIAFYRDVVGMELADGPFASRTAAADELLGNPHGIRFAWMRHEGLLLQLVQYTAGGGDVLHLDHANVGTPHLSFVVDDIEARHRALAERGDVDITPQIVTMARGQSFYAHDPDGLPVEFWQWDAEQDDPLATIPGAPEHAGS
jgi:catechol 2,3-dioxygenase-like lactoylglutathione lyase family enzyme